MTLLEGETLWNLAWILPIIAILFYWSSRKRNRILRCFLGKRADDPECVNSSPGRRFWRGLIFAGILILLIAAAARPSWGVRILPYSGQGRDLMVVFDVSKSMLAQDVRPSRLEHAKWLVRQLCMRNPGDRFGLIAFAGNAFLECPLTIDQTSFLQSVDELSVDSIPVGGTNIQQALTEAIRGFQAAETPHRAVILITDGDELTGSGAKALVRIKELKIPLFILGIGDPAQPAIVQVPDGKGGIQTLKDQSGNVVSVPLNEKMLAGLARETGGIYVRSTTTHPGLDQIEARIKKLEKHGIDSGKQTRPIERPLYPLLGAFILFCLWLMLGERSDRPFQRKSAKLILLFGLAGLFFNVSAQDAVNTVKENAPTEQKKEIQTEKLSPEELYNLGLKAQTQEKDACVAFVETLLSQDIQDDYGRYDYCTPVRISSYETTAQEAIDAYNRNVEDYSRYMSEAELREMGMAPADSSAIDGFESMIETCSQVSSLDPAVMAIIREEMPAYFSGQKTLDDVIVIMEDRVQTFINERG